MTDVPEKACPQCGLSYVIPEFHRRAEEFCTGCDYPLFFAPGVVVDEGPESSEEAAMRRQPGAEGKDAAGARRCPHCGERNQAKAVECVRCGGDLRLVKPTSQERLVLPAMPEAPPPLDDPSRLPLIITGLVFVLVVILLVLTIWVW